MADSTSVPISRRRPCKSSSSSMKCRKCLSFRSPLQHGSWSFRVSRTYGPAEIHTFCKEYHIFRNIGGMVGDSLQVARHKNEVDRCRNRDRVMLHELDELSVDFVTQRVHLVVGRDEALRQLRIDLDECIQT